mgnify:CR=1 FL=1
MKEIKRITALFFISLLLLLVGCEEGGNEIDGKKPADVKSIAITMIAKSSANPVFESAKIGAIKTAESISEKSLCNLKFIIHHSSFILEILPV